MLRGNLGKTWTFGAKAKEDSGAWSKELVKFTCTREMRRALQASDEAVEGIRSVGIRLDASHADCTILRAELKTRMQDFINSEDSDNSDVDCYDQLRFEQQVNPLADVLQHLGLR